MEILPYNTCTILNEGVKHCVNKERRRRDTGKERRESERQTDRGGGLFKGETEKQRYGHAWKIWHDQKGEVE